MSTAMATDTDYWGTVAEQFLRSINLKYDIDAPERISHFRPTSKSIPLIRSLAFGDRSESLLVVAPYGSGKSLLATFVGQVVENRPSHSEVLRGIAVRTRDLSDDLHEALMDRLDPGQLVRPSGMAIVLHGFQRDLAGAVRDGYLNALDRIGLRKSAGTLDLEGVTNLDDLLRRLTELKPDLKAAGADADLDVGRVVILWDEFGRHLEELVANGDAARLSEVQLLAEFVSRQKTIVYSFAAFLHQSMASYAAGLSQTVRREWKKIEGRFDISQFVDDSRELMALVSEIVASNVERTVTRSSEQVEALLRRVRDVGLFSEMSEEGVRLLLEKAYPIEPVTLYLLPRVSARVGQNERTLFSFLFGVDLREPVGPGALFDYFENAMRGDTGVGGSYHQWLETQNAIGKTVDEDSADVVKAAGLLGLGVSGERSRVGRELLTVAVAGYRRSWNQAKSLVDQLVRQKLLLNRRATDQVAIWHGVDVDLRGRLDEEKARLGLSFDAIDFISKELPPSPILPLEYNAEYRITRYFASRYVAASEIDEALEESEARIRGGSDGVVLHVVPEDEDDAAGVVEALRRLRVPERIVFSIPKKTMPIYDLALEVYVLRKMEEDDALTSEDPLVVPELRQMTDDALEYLRRSLMRLCVASADGPTWVYGGKAENVMSQSDLRLRLSDIMRRTFAETPRINNELIVRKRPRQVIVNARKSLVGAILDHYGEENLGLDGYGPDRSMLSTVLLQTGLYAKEGDAWHFAVPERISDRRLRKVWQRFRGLVSKPSRSSKSLRAFFDELEKPPIGLRGGLFPIFLAAALRAFPSVISIAKGGTYVPDITQSVIEGICDKPEEYEFRVLKMESDSIVYLMKVRECFSSDEFKTAETDHLRMVYDAVQRWLASLAPAALGTRRVSGAAIRLRELLTGVDDPVDLFLFRLPEEYSGGTRRIAKNGLKKLRSAVKELEGVTSIYYDLAEATIRDTLQLRGSSDIVRQVKRWSDLVPDGAVDGMTNALAKALYFRMRMTYDTSERLVDSIASLLVERTVNRWDDSSVSAFDRIFRSAVSQLEEYVLDVARRQPAMAENLSRLAELRIKNLYEYLSEMVGTERAKKSLLRIAGKEQIRG